MNRPLGLALALAAFACAAAIRPPQVQADIYFGDEVGNRIIRLDPVTGLYETFATWDAATNDTPFGMAMTSDANPKLLVADKGRHHVVEIVSGSTPSMTNLVTRGGDNTMRYPHDLVLLPDGDMLVTSTQYGVSGGGPTIAPVYRFQGPDGASPGSLVSKLADSSAIAHATGLAYEPSVGDPLVGTLYIASSGTNEIFKYAYDVSTDTLGAATVFSYSGAELADPADITIGPDGRLLVAGWGDDRVGLIDTSTGAISYLTAPPTGFDGPAGFAIEGNDVYISDYFNSRIYRYIYDTGSGDYLYDRTYDIPGTKPLFMTTGPALAPVPEPGGLALLSLGLAGLAIRRWRSSPGRS